MTEPYFSTAVSTGAQLDEILSYVSRLEQNDEQPIGYLKDLTSSSPTLQRIDINGNNFNPSSDFFNNWCITGKMRRVARNRNTGKLTPGTNNRGDGLLLDGSMGDILVEIPTCHYKLAYAEGDHIGAIIIPFSTEETKYKVHPCAPQRGGVPRNRIYVGAYEGSLGLDATGNKILTSTSGSQPWTGGEIRSLSFTSGGLAGFTKGEQLTGATSGAVGYIVDYYLTSGTWAGGDAAGVVYLRLPGVATSTAIQFIAESLTGSVSGIDCATAVGAASVLSLTLDQAEDYANAVGTGFGICNPYTYAYIRQLMYTEYGTLNIQSVLGDGIVNLDDMPGFSGKLTGADSIDLPANTAINGTGKGTGVNGQTPVKWRGLENISGGNCWELVIGINMFNSNGTDGSGNAYTAGSYRVVNPDGTGSLAGELPAGSYVTGIGTLPASDGYISTIQTDEIGLLLGLPSGVAGTSSTDYCDWFYHQLSAPASLRHGGVWYEGVKSGISCMNGGASVSNSARSYGARLEYIPQS